MSRFWSPNELESISSATIEHYNANANSFWHGTKDHDVTQNYEALLSALPNKKGLSLLDLGCGPGRDLLYFKKEGHHAIGLDGSYEFCEMAKSLTGLLVLQQDFLKLELAGAVCRRYFCKCFALSCSFTGNDQGPKTAKVCTKTKRSTFFFKSQRKQRGMAGRSLRHLP